MDGYEETREVREILTWSASLQLRVFCYGDDKSAYYFDDLWRKDSKGIRREWKSAIAWAKEKGKEGLFTMSTKHVLTVLLP